MQQWAHDYLLSNGYTEADFTATVYIITHESGWSVTATNPSSGAYGLPQALPGSKMVSEGADWLPITRPSSSGSGAIAHSVTVPFREPIRTGLPTTATDMRRHLISSKLVLKVYADW